MNLTADHELFKAYIESKADYYKYEYHYELENGKYMIYYSDGGCYTEELEVTTEQLLNFIYLQAVKKC